MTESTPASERVREAYDSLPGQEQRVDYPRIHNAILRTIDLPDVSDLEIELTIRTPDGRTFTYREQEEYELDDDGLPLSWEMGDAKLMLNEVVATMRARLG